MGKIINECHEKDHLDIHEWVMINNYIIDRIRCMLGDKKTNAVINSTKFNPVIALMHELHSEFIVLKGKLKNTKRRMK